ncbi:MAG: phospholipase D family protein [Xylanivirga thermophila]|uniref:phospholipase D-like domain-containing protein n=1 Tax=Xylanivirga thermophila TaxID=2496273 RepID=UPI00101D9678|nr:phospholipase D family protein [Xylanivirga thermophila]
MKSINKIMNSILQYYMIYALIFGVLIFGFYGHKKNRYRDIYPSEMFYGEDVCSDRIVLVEERYSAGLARVNLIENAKESLEISYHTIKDGVAANIFFGCILDAADRGVQVRIILDGIFHNLRGNLKDVIYAFYAHPNIELKFYEPFSIMRPWTWNNRLHDKFIIVDDHIAMIGGRNIGDKYFTPKEYGKKITNDRDVVIINTDENNFPSSVIYHLKKYFDDVWNHRFLRYPIKKLTVYRQKRAERKAQVLNEYIKALENTNPDIFHNKIDWIGASISARKITLVHNPIEHFNKNPWCWYAITNLINEADKSVYIQSPYIIPTRSMLRHLNYNNIIPEKMHILTNSEAVTPNIPAYSGHIRHIKDMVDFGINVYEFQGPGSIHAKSFIFDDRISVVGSFNIDSRSTYLSTETMIVVDSEDFARVLKREMGKDFDRSLMLDNDYSYIYNPLVEEQEISFLKHFVIKIVSFITYFFDYML